MYRSKKYKTFISSKPCLICGMDSDPHHEPMKRGGKGIKAPDTHCLPLCHNHHTERHAVGPDTFWGEHNEFNLPRLCLGYVTEYMERNGL
jgi:hypothetical protein